MKKNADNKNKTPGKFIFDRSPNYSISTIASVRVSISTINNTVILEPNINLPPMPDLQDNNTFEVRFLSAYFLNLNGAKALLEDLQRAVNDLENSLCNEENDGNES